MPIPTVNTSATELHWVVVGYDTRQHRNVALGYICDTRAQAYAKCQKLHPDVDIYFVRLGDLN